MRYYVNSYPNPRAEDGETSGYWQQRSQVFGKPIINPNPEKVDLDGDGIVEARQSSLLTHKAELQKPEKPVDTAKDGKKISFDKTSIDTNGKIALDLVANDINQLVKDLYDIGVDGVITSGNNASIRISASKIPALEQLSSLAFGKTTQKGITRKDGKITGIAIPEQPEGENEVPSTNKKNFDVSEQENVRINLPNSPTVDTIGEGKKKKTFEEIEKEGEEFIEKATRNLLINPANSWGGGYMLPGGDSARSLVPGQPPSNFAGNTVSASTKGVSETARTLTKKVSETAKTLTKGTTNKRKKVSGTGVTFSQNTSEERTGTKHKSTKSAVKGQAKLPQGSKRNAFGQPIRPNSSASRTIKGNSSGGSSKTQQIRMGGNSSGGSSGGGTKVQVSHGSSKSKGSSGRTSNPQPAGTRSSSGKGMRQKAKLLKLKKN